MTRTKYLYLNSRDEFFRVEIHKIVYFEADGNYTSFFLRNGLKGTVLLSLAQMQATLSEHLKEQAQMFARVGRRHIINLNCVFRIEVAHQRLTLSDGETFAYRLQVARETLRKLKELYVSSITGNKAENNGQA